MSPLILFTAGMEDGTIKSIDIRTNQIVNTFSLPTRVRKIRTVQSNPNFLLCGLEVRYVCDFISDDYVFLFLVFSKLGLPVHM